MPEQSPRRLQDHIGGRAFRGRTRVEGKASFPEKREKRADAISPLAPERKFPPFLRSRERQL
jgi:hypothetical protein